MGEMGLFGLITPKEYGGFGLNQTGYARVLQNMVRYDHASSIIAIAHQSIGIKALLLFGNEVQKKQYLPDLAAGKRIAGFALTEPGAGSDAYAITAHAKPTDDGKAFILNGEKIWITNGGIGSFFTVFAKTPEGDKEKVTAFIVTREMAGFSSGKEEHKMGIRGSSTTALSFDNVRVPIENIIGERGKGFKIAMSVLNSGRLGLGAGCVGAIKKIIQLATDHAQQRKQFGKPIAEYGLIQEKIGRMMIDVFALESMVFLAASLMDRGIEDYSMESAICKVFGSEALVRSANEALQIAGGAGYMQEYPYEQLVRDARILTIFEGTNEVLRCFIALNGLQVTGEHLKVIGNALHDPIKSFGLLFSELVVHKLSNQAHVTKAHPELKREASMIEENVRRLNASAEKALMKYKKEITTKQFIQKRLSEIAIDLFGMFATVSRTSAALNQPKLYKSEELQSMLNLCRTFCAEATQRITSRVQNMNENNDEGIKDAARFAYKENGYKFDVL
jgi:acyl-CoA dehydrogenase family protein 9